MKVGPRYKVCRRLGNGVFDKCQSQSYLLSEARHAKSAPRRRSNVSDFAKQLLEKQKLRMVYGLSDRQLRRYVAEANRTGGEVSPSVRLIQLLESRIDNVLYRAGLAKTRRMARQLVSHGHVTINGRKTSVPSTAVTEGDQFGVRQESATKPVFELAKERLAEVKAPVWVHFDTKALTGTIAATPSAEATDLPYDANAVLEFFSR